MFVIDVEQVDAVSVPTRDRERARRFYAETLGLASDPGSPDEFETTNVTLGLWEPPAEGEPFEPNTAGIALRVADVGRSRERLEKSGVRFHGENRRHRRLPHGVLLRPRRKRAHSAPAVRVTIGRALLAATTVTFGLLAGAASAEARYAPVSWSERKADAIELVEARAGVESFAFVDEEGRMRGYHRWRPTPSASVLKPMLMVAYLSLRSVRDRALNDRDRSLLAPMIKRSDNATASTVLSIVGSSGLYRVARRAHMRHFRVHLPVWGLTEITAGDQARFFYRIDSYVPVRHRAYSRYLLSHIVSSQRWGIPPEVPTGWKVFFKGGWGSGTGRVTHQVALLEEDDRRLAIAVLTEFNPSHEYGTRTVRGVAARLLRVPLPGPTPSG